MFTSTSVSKSYWLNVKVCLSRISSSIEMLSSISSGANSPPLYANISSRLPPFGRPVFRTLKYCLKILYKGFLSPNATSSFHFSIICVIELVGTRSRSSANKINRKRSSNFWVFLKSNSLLRLRSVQASVSGLFFTRLLYIASRNFE